jgi:integrase
MIYATESDLERLTDYRSPAKQIEYLARQNIPFAISGDIFLFSTRGNQPYINFDEDTTTAFDSIWQRAKQRAVKAGLLEPFQERDLRAKAATDSETLEEARAILGHSTTLMTRTVYRRKPEIVKKTA